jgi:hypothetical protein
LTSVANEAPAAAGAGAETSAVVGTAGERLFGGKSGGRRSRRRARGPGHLRQVRAAIEDELHDVAERREVAQAELVVARDVVGGADGGEGLGLLDGVDAEVGLQVELHVEHVARIAGLVGDDGQDRLSDARLRTKGPVPRAWGPAPGPPRSPGRRARSSGEQRLPPSPDRASDRARTARRGPGSGSRAGGACPRAGCRKRRGRPRTSRPA